MFRSSCFALLLISAGSALAQGEKKMTPLDRKVVALDGKELDLAKFKGKVVLVVNVASACGYTGQYAGMQKLYEKYGKDGFVVLGVPANDFGAQEPGSNEDIAKFCSSQYKVTFPMLAKVSATGKNIAPLLKDLTGDKAIGWNFEKFLIGADGMLIARYGSGTEPEDLEKDIEKALKK